MSIHHMNQDSVPIIRPEPAWSASDEWLARRNGIRVMVFLEKLFYSA